MILLSFTVRNHKSIRDEVAIDLTRSALKTLQPKDGNWSAVSYPLAGIFGGNATGKSAVLDALRYAFTAILHSATVWQESKSMRRAPFKLDGNSRTSTSLYELDLVHDGRRYVYGFEVDQDGIRREWLRDVPSSRWRTLLERDREEGLLTFHPSLRTKIEVTPRELVLSRALLLKESSLYAFADDLVESFDIVLVKDSHRAVRLSKLADSLADGDVTFPDLEALLQVADIGVLNVSIEETNIPERIRLAFRRLERDLREEEDEDASVKKGEPDGEDDPEELEADELEQVARRLLFTHRGTADDCPPFSIHEESDGTIAWLAIAVPALEALRGGGLLLVDEIDASLHPHLLEVLLGAFSDPLVNRHHAQLIFTSHESYVLSPLSEVRLEPEQIWLTDKTNEGVTELTCLADFPKHPDANVAKRYLTGRYGGTPRLSPSLFAALVDAGEA
ncbi:ATP-binding protein [Brachybacterium sp. EF45031]|uniref:AAA family ATPase n=1 Tax=Brachybacterium sillae TaxID=2810536 RepID=UPI00217E66A4|nr:ATP-binding protein [Brachybacterium sillae]MCS6711765.1 ATP-binding protein [Brachybacterium sillae]